MQNVSQTSQQFVVNQVGNFLFHSAGINEHTAWTGIGLCRFTNMARESISWSLFIPRFLMSPGFRAGYQQSQPSNHRLAMMYKPWHELTQLNHLPSVNIPTDVQQLVWEAPVPLPLLPAASVAIVCDWWSRCHVMAQLFAKRRGAVTSYKHSSATYTRRRCGVSCSSHSCDRMFEGWNSFDKLHVAHHVTHYVYPRRCLNYYHPSFRYAAVTWSDAVCRFSARGRL